MKLTNTQMETLTPEEIRETLFRTLDRLDDEYRDRLARDEQAKTQKEADEQEIANLKARLKEEKSARMKAEEKASEMERENVSLKKALEDEKNRNRTNVRNTFGSKSI